MRIWHRQAQREDVTKTKGEDGHLRAKERSHGRKLTLLTPYLGILASRIMKKYISVV